MATVKLNNTRVRSRFVTKDLLRLVKFLFGLLLLLNIGWLFYAVNDLKIENKILRRKLDPYIETPRQDLKEKVRSVRNDNRALSETINSQAEEVSQIKDYIDRSISELTQKLDKMDVLLSKRYQGVIEREQALEKKVNELALVQKSQNRNEAPVNQKNIEEVKKLVSNASEEITKLQTSHKKINDRVEGIRLEVFGLSEGLRRVKDGSSKDVKDKKQFEAILNSYVSAESMKAVTDSYNKKVTDLNNQLNSQKNVVNRMEQELNVLKRQSKEGLFGMNNAFIQNSCNSKPPGPGNFSSCNQGANNKEDKKNKEKKRC